MNEPCLWCGAPAEGRITIEAGDDVTAGAALCSRHLDDALTGIEAAAEEAGRGFGPRGKADGHS